MPEKVVSEDVTASIPAMNREVRFGLTSLGLGAACVLLGYFPTVQLAGAGTVASMLAGVAVSLAASWAGAVPVALMRNRAAAFGPSNVAMAAMLVRFVIVLALALAIALSGKVDRAVFLIWVGISYMVLLAADTHYALQSSPINPRKEQH
jgi:hypothetical protein